MKFIYWGIPTAILGVGLFIAAIIFALDSSQSSGVAMAITLSFLVALTGVVMLIHGCRQRNAAENEKIRENFAIFRRHWHRIILPNLVDVVAVVLATIIYFLLPIMMNMPSVSRPDGEVHRLATYSIYVDPGDLGHFGVYDKVVAADGPHWLRVSEIRSVLDRSSRRSLGTWVSTFTFKIDPKVAPRSVGKLDVRFESGREVYTVRVQPYPTVGGGFWVWLWITVSFCLLSRLYGVYELLILGRGGFDM